MSIRMISLLLLVWCLLVSPCLAVNQVIRYVDPDVVGGAGDGTSWANAYNSLQKWDDNAYDLQAADDYMQVYCRSSSGSADPNQVTIQGVWNPDETRYIEIIQDDFPSDGIWDATAYRLRTPGTGTAASALNVVATEYVHISGLQVECYATANAPYSVIYQSGSDYERIDKLIIKGNLSGVSAVRALYLYGGVRHTVTNCIFYDITSGGQNDVCGIFTYNCTYADIFNCTFYNCDVGIFENGTATTVIKNCILANCNDDLSGHEIGAGDTVAYCCSDDGEGTNVQSPLNSDWDQEMTDPNNGVFSLVAGGNAIGNGVDDPNNGAYSDDILGVTRSSPWDIGAFEYGAAASGAQIMWLKVED